MENQTLILIVMLVYISLLMLWGIFQGKKVKTGDDFAIAAMISTADSLLILSATEFSENILKPLMKQEKPLSAKKNLLISRIITALLAIIALASAWLTGKGTFIFTLVSYVWAGIGGTFSVVILLTLFWKKYHGKAAVVTIIYGIGFTILWINTGMEQVISSRLMTFASTFLVAILATRFLNKPGKQNRIFG